MDLGYLDLPDLIREKIWLKLGFQSRTNLRLTCTALYNEYNDEDIWKGPGITGTYKRISFGDEKLVIPERKHCSYRLAKNG